MAQPEWKSIGRLPVEKEWKFTTFFYGKFFRVSSNSENDYFFLGVFDFPKKSNLIFSRGIYLRDKTLVYPRPETPFPQFCVGIRGKYTISGLVINVEVLKGETPP